MIIDLYSEFFNFKRESIFKKMVILTWSRSSTIIPSMLGHTIAVYNGREHIALLVSDQMIGYLCYLFFYTLCILGFAILF